MVAARWTTIKTHPEKVGMRSVPILHGLNWCLAFERRLRELMVVQSHTAQHRLLQVCARMEAVRPEHIANAPVEALHHPVGFGCPGLFQLVLDTKSPRTAGQTSGR